MQQLIHKLPLQLHFRTVSEFYHIISKMQVDDHHIVMELDVSFQNVIHHLLRYLLHCACSPAHHSYLCTIQQDGAGHVVNGFGCMLKGSLAPLQCGPLAILH